MNPVEVLEERLFNFNPKLEVIWFETNKIRSIGQTTFDNLNALRDLDLGGNTCVSKRVSNRYGIESFVALLKDSCFTPESSTTMATTTLIATTSNAKDPENSNSGMTWIIVGISIFCVFIIVNIIVIMKYYRKKTIIVKPIEP